MPLLSNTKNDFENLSGLPWECLFADGAHYVVSGRTRKTIAVFADEKNARLVVEILSAFPEILEDFEDTRAGEEYREVVDNNMDLENELASERQALRVAEARFLDLQVQIREITLELGEALDGAE